MDKIKKLLIEISERTDDIIIFELLEEIQTSIRLEQEKPFGQRMKELFMDFDFDYQEWVCFDGDDFDELMEYAQNIIRFKNDPLVRII